MLLDMEWILDVFHLRVFIIEVSVVCISFNWIFDGEGFKKWILNSKGVTWYLIYLETFYIAWTMTWGIFVMPVKKEFISTPLFVMLDLREREGGYSDLFNLIKVDASEQNSLKLELIRLWYDNALIMLSKKWNSGDLFVKSKSIYDFSRRVRIVLNYYSF